MRRGSSAERAAAPRFVFEPMGPGAARAILAWRSEGPYAVYNCAPARLEAAAGALPDPDHLGRICPPGAPNCDPERRPWCPPGHPHCGPETLTLRKCPGGQPTCEPEH
jgi:hypothetical protein